MTEITSYEQACEMFGTTKESLSDEILMSYKNLNDNLSKIAFSETEILKAKEILLVDLFPRQVEELRHFEIVSPFQNTCPVCNGTGLRFKWVKKSIEIPCYVCSGKKVIKKKVKCETCKIIHTEITKCSKCLGKGKIKKLVLDSKIESTTPCKRCQQKGFIEPKPSKKKYLPAPLNPVITTSLAMQIKEQFNNSEDTPPSE